MKGFKSWVCMNYKSNPSIGDLHKTNDRMLKILDSIGLKATGIEVPKEDIRSPDDLT